MCSKKVLIITHSTDSAVIKVIEKIEQRGFSVLRLNTDSIESGEINSSFGLDELKFGSISLSTEFHSLWLWRWSHSFSDNIFNEYCLEDDPQLLIKIRDSLLTDSLNFRTWLLGNIRTKKILTNHRKVAVNKLIVLQLAKTIGLNVPDFIFTNNKTELLKFISSKKNSLVIKDISSPFIFTNGNEMLVSYTELLTNDNIDTLDNYFRLTFFQEYIEKLYEVRSFYLLGKIYSMAIFTQQDPLTKIDSRKYNAKAMNRMVPYKLPDTVENSLINLMNSLELNTGSIDFLVTEDEKFVFLEVNPVGQFELLSEICGYHLEDKIADFLTT